VIDLEQIARGELWLRTSPGWILAPRERCQLGRNIEEYERAAAKEQQLRGRTQSRGEKDIVRPTAGGRAILPWAIRGCRDWQREGLGYPGVIRDKTTDLRKSFDPLTGFFEECYEFGSDYSVPSGKLRERYNAWAKEYLGRGDKKVSNQEWGDRLEAAGCTRDMARIHGKVTRWWNGIRLINLEEEENNPNE
jgi:hypothetical protein